MAIETPSHLYEPPLYRGSDGEWSTSIWSSLERETTLTLDPTAIASVLSLNYVSGDRTLFREVKRKPWLSKIQRQGVELLEVPPHGRRWLSANKAAQVLLDLLKAEAREVCRDREDIYILLSGGLDSRIVAGVMVALWEEGSLKTRPRCVTWGLEQSRDVHYGRVTAERLGFPWSHVPIGPQDLVINLEMCDEAIGSMVSPTHLHCMHWFSTVSHDALVLAGSYGDSVGRGEFSRRTLLELDYLRIANWYSLLKPEVFEQAKCHFYRDLQNLHVRVANSPKYVKCECEQQSIYMRNMIAHAMSSINRYATVYQMFTAPDVYRFIWSLHPSARTDSLYACLLRLLGHDLDNLPWARDNRAPSGKTHGANKALSKTYQKYVKWISHDVYDKYSSYYDPDWFAGTNIFEGNRIAALGEELTRIRNGQAPPRTFVAERWLWLLSLRKIVEKTASKVQLGNERNPSPAQVSQRLQGAVPFRTRIKESVGKITWLSGPSEFMVHRAKAVKRQVLRLLGLLRYLPTGKG